MTDAQTIYMDHHSTTPVDPRVLEAMLPYFSEKFGNAASVTHAYGWEAEAAVETARGQVAALIGAEPKDIAFTSGATESDNLALKGVAAALAERGDHIITTVIEHKAVIDSGRWLESEGIRITWLPVGSDGLVDPESVREAITDRTILISVMAANNEVGTVEPIREIGQIARERSVLFHTDAAQAIGRIPLDVDRDHIDLLSISAHKIYGPKGIGALYVRRRKPRARLKPLIDGGGHERGLRSGTLPVPLIVGFGEAMAIAAEEMETESERVAALRDRLLHAIIENCPDVHVNGSMEHRLPNNLNLSFASVEGEGILMDMKEVALSSGSACSSAHVEPSYVLKAMGRTDELAQASIRFGLGRSTTAAEVDHVARRIVETVARLRRLSPLYRVPSGAYTPRP